MQEIKNPERSVIVKFDGVTASTVYVGSFNDLIKAPLKWKKNKRISEAMRMEVYTLTLDEIRKQCGNCAIITVFIESPMHGEILQWGNYGDSWWQIGETCGYW